MFGKGKFSRSTKIIACCAIVAYIVILAGIFVIAPLFETPENVETYGDLSGRFQSGAILNYMGQDYIYRTGDVENILILGVDGKRGIGKDARLKGQADFLLILSVDRRNKLVTPIAIDRDMMISVPLYGIFGDPAGTDIMQICLAHTFSNAEISGGENTLRALSECLGELPIEHYVTIDIPGITYLNDAVGGVELTLEDDFSHIDPAMQAGKTLRLNGAQAELFVRGRMNTASGTNHFRIQRQIQYLSPLLNSLSEMIRKDVSAADSLLDSLDEHLESSFRRGEMVRLAHRFSDYELAAPIILPGTNSLGIDKSIEFWLDWDNTAQLLIDICYEKKE